MEVRRAEDQMSASSVGAGQGLPAQASSDAAAGTLEFGILGAVGATIYQLVKKYNCHEPGCWRVGNHPAADGQFNLCYRHHPDFQGRKPTHELIERLHHEHLERQAAVHSKLQEIHQQLATRPGAANDIHGPGQPAHNAQAAGNHQSK
jgi:hypothetical protein